MDPGPSELEERCRRFLEGRGDAVAPLLRCMGNDGDARAGTGAWAALIASRIFFLKGNLSLAKSYLRLASALSGSAGDETLRLGLLVNKALIVKARGKPREAARLLRAVVDRALRNNETFVAAKGASNLALCMARCGEAEGAAPYLGLAERCYAALGYESGLILLDMTHALVEAKQGLFEEAVDRLYLILGRCAEERFARERLVGLLLLAELFTDRGDLAHAREALDKAASMKGALARFGRERLEWLCLENAYNRKSGNVEESRRFAETAERLRRRLGIPVAYAEAGRRGANASSAVRETAPRIMATRQEAGPSNEPVEEFITGGRGMLELLAGIERAAHLSLPILIEGESGTGKDLVARLVHRWSGRGREPFVAVNVAALPLELFESMAFGHARGAFTGAASRRDGLVAAAGRGTLFLDEIGELAPAAQGKLLRFIDRREYIPLGETRPRRFEARIVAATNRDLKADCASGRFRQDLYYRLAPLVFRIPPLRERREDIAHLARHLLGRMRTIHGLGPARLHEGVLAALARHTWPGNVRELESEILRAALKARGDEIRPCHLSPSLMMSFDAGSVAGAASLRAKRASLERSEIIEALRACGGNRSSAARRLGLKRTTLIGAMRRLDIDW